MPLGGYPYIWRARRIAWTNRDEVGRSRIGTYQCKTYRIRGFAYLSVTLWYSKALGDYHEVWNADPYTALHWHELADERPQIVDKLNAMCYNGSIAVVPPCSIREAYDIAVSDGVIKSSDVAISRYIPNIESEFEWLHEYKLELIDGRGRKLAKELLEHYRKHYSDAVTMINGDILLY